MHKLFAFIFTALAVTASADVIDSRARNFMNSRRICVRRDCTTLPGYCIEYWERNGKQDTKLPAVVTNKLYAVAGAEQNNQLKNALDLARRHIDIIEAQLQVSEAKVAASRKVLVEKRAEYVAKRDDAKLPTTKAIYQTFIDVIDDILKKMDALAAGGAS